MSRLFLIGNGYDISRLNGKTSYHAFNQWLKDNYPEEKDLFLNHNEDSSYPAIIYRIAKFPNEIVSSVELKHKKLASSFLQRVFREMSEKNKQDYWKCFENTLGEIDYYSFVKQWENYNEELGINMKGTIGSPNSLETDITTNIASGIRKLFVEWIQTISEDGVTKKEFEKYCIKEIQYDDTFISFNYTYTIERLFDLNNCYFCHIHGEKGKESSIVVGHNNNDIYKYINAYDDDEDDCIYDMYRTLKKYSEQIVIEKDYLWDKLKNKFSFCSCNEVYEFGWSCSTEDEPYIKKIVSLLNKNDIVYINNFNNEGFSKIKKWKKYGFKGKLFLYNEKDGEIVKFRYTIFRRMMHFLIKFFNLFE